MRLDFYSFSLKAVATWCRVLETPMEETASYCPEEKGKELSQTTAAGREGGHHWKERQVREIPNFINFTQPLLTPKSCMCEVYWNSWWLSQKNWIEIWVDAHCSFDKVSNLGPTKLIACWNTINRDQNWIDPDAAIIKNDLEISVIPTLDEVKKNVLRMNEKKNMGNILFKNGNSRNEKYKIQNINWLE